MAEIEIVVPLGTIIILVAVGLLVYLFARRFLFKVLANSILGLVAFFLLNLAGFKLSYSLLNLGLVAALGLAGFVLVIALKLLGWTS